LVDAGTLRVVTSFKITALRDTSEGIVVEGGRDMLEPVDEIVATTGFRPDLSLVSELRLGLDPAVESPTALARLIDPNVHSCGTVPPHGAEELRHPERDFYIVGMKSYGRAPTFLLLTGYEQVRSVAAALAGVCSSGENGSCDTAPLVAPSPFAVALPRPAPVRELALAEAVASCCAPAEQETCCDPSEKAACCGASAEGTCGCQ